MLLISMTQEIRVVMQGNTHSQGGGMSVRRPGFVLGAISILLTSAITSCSAPVDSVLNGLGDGNGDRTNFRGVPQEDTDQGQSGQNPEGNIKVAPGTLPPTGEPQPGHARLNSDGYYDYTADDFVLGDPCPAEIRANFADDGYDLHHPSEADASTFKNGELCIALINQLGLGTGITIEEISVNQVPPETGELSFKKYEEYSTYTIQYGSGTYGVCKAGIDTPEGSRGIFETWGEGSNSKDADAACSTAHDRLMKYTLGKI